MRRVVFAFGLLLSVGACMAGMDMGDDSGPFAHDGECDDPRFTGGGMASGLNAAQIKHDASDCSTLLAAGRIRPAATGQAWNPQQCKAIDFGDNSSTFARDGECDDPRFTGPGVDNILVSSDEKADAQDCRAACFAGEVWLK